MRSGKNPSPRAANDPSLRRTALFALCALISAAATGFFTTAAIQSR